jgi:hypothetical protein
MVDIDWVAHKKALLKKRKGDSRAEQLAGDDIMFWATFHEQHGAKLKDLIESVMLDLRYSKRLDLTSDILMREALEALLRTINGCSVEVKKKREPKKETMKLKI